MSDLPSADAVPSPLEAMLREAPRRPRGLLAMVAVFLVSFALLQGVYGFAGGWGAERLLVETLGSRPAAALIRSFTPEIPARAEGARVTAPGGGINIRAGCEGSEVLFLLAAAFLAVPMAGRSRLLGLLAGGALVIALNLCRILALFYAYRSDRDLFDLLHTIVAPVVLIAATGLYFHAWISFRRPLPLAG